MVDVSFHSLIFRREVVFTKVLEHMPKAPVSLRTLFEQGRYTVARAHLKTLTPRAWSHFDSSKDMSEWAAAIGTLSHSASPDEALEFYRLGESSADSSSQIEAHYHLCIGFVRRSDYPGGRIWILRAWKTFRAFRSSMNHTDRDRAEFFASQASAFLSFFSGKFNVSSRWARRARGASLRAGFQYGQILSADLSGHVLAQIGKLQESIATFQEALDIATSIGNETFQFAIRVSLIDLKATVEVSSKTLIEELESLRASIPREDHYSYTVLEIRRAHRLLLMGRKKKARSILEGLCQEVYVFNNQRQASAVNFMLAYIFALEGQTSSALLVLKSAESCLDPKVDFKRLIQVIGLQERIANSLPSSESDLFVEQLESSLNQLTDRAGGWIAKRIRARRMSLDFRIGPVQNKGIRVFRRGEDSLGDLIDDLSMQHEAALELIIRSGNLGLLRFFYQIEFGQRMVVWDEAHEFGVIWDRGEVRLLNEPLSASALLMLQRLARGRAHKQELVEEVWGHRYHPLRHDNLVYTTIARIRKAMGVWENWIESDEQGYRLKPHVGVVSWSPELARGPSREMKTLEEPTNFINIKTAEGLNARQIRFLRDLSNAFCISENQTGTSVSEYADRYSVPKVTASRDLSRLAQMGRLRVVGKGRATRYFKL